MLQYDNSGRKASGAKAYFYSAGTTTPLVVYQDALATTPHANPVVADANGRFAAVYIPYGSYKEIVTDSGGAQLWSNDNIPNVDPATGSGGGGGGDTFATGDIKARFDTTTETGWVRLNGNTIGSASSGASERANDDTEDLFLHLWNKLTDTEAAVVGGRGASAAADWAANKRITLPNGQQRPLIGIDGMGGTAVALIGSSVIANPTRPGATGGSATHTLATTEIPAHSHTGSVSITDPQHSHGISDPSHVHGGTLRDGGYYANGGGGNIGNIPIYSPGNTNASQTGIASSASNATGISASVTINNAGGGGAHNNVQPVLTVVWYIKL